MLLAAYQGERFLPEQLRSLREQTDPCFRVLMQDDGSRDGTPELLCKTAAEDPRFGLAAEQGRRLGPAGNFLSLLRQAEDPLIALCDQDDCWEPERLSRGREALEQAEARFGADMPILVHSDCRLVDERGETLAPSFFAHQGWRADAVGLPELLVQNNVTGCTTLMNRPLALLAAGADPSRVFMHDWFLAQIAAAFGHIVFVDAPLVRYRQHGENVLGASKNGILGRAASALRMPARARERMRLCYREAEALLDAHRGKLPSEAKKTLIAFLKTRELPWPARPLAVWRMGCRMQSLPTRIGQWLFG